MKWRESMKEKRGINKKGYALFLGVAFFIAGFSFNTEVVKAKETGIVNTVLEETLHLDEEKTIFLTDTGVTYYQRLEVTDAQKYLLHASSLADSVSIVIANDKQEIVDILDKNTTISNEGGLTYTTSALTDLSAGTWYIGVSSQRVAKITLKVSKPVAVTQDVAATQKVTPKDTMIAYSFTPAQDGIYHFFQADTRSDLTLKLYDEAGKVKRNVSGYRWLGDWKVCFNELQISLEKGKMYYLTVSGNYYVENAKNSLTVSRLLEKDCAKFSVGKEVSGSIENYNKYVFYKIKPERTGEYFINAASGDGYLEYSVYSEEENLIQKASITKSGYDSYDNRVYKTQSALSLKAGKTYYLILRMADCGKGDYSLKLKKLEKVKKITLIHKPNKKIYIKNLDSWTDLSGTVLSIKYKNGKNTKWVYDTSDSYKEGFKVQKKIKKVGKNKVVTFTYRNQSVSYKIPILKVNEAYSKAKELKKNKTREDSLKYGKYRFYRFVPKENGLYGFEGISTNYFRLAIFGEKGGRKARGSSRYVRNAVTSAGYYRCRVAQPLVKGKTYYIGAYYPYSGYEGQIQMKTYADDPVAPKKLTIKRTTDAQIKLSWKEVKRAFGYQIIYYPADNSKKKECLTTVYATGNYIDGLKKGTTYYFKVRAYRQIGNKKYYGDFSEIKAFYY